MFAYFLMPMYLEFWASRGTMDPILAMASNQWGDRAARNTLSPGFPLEKPPDKPPARPIPTDVPIPEPIDVPVPEPHDVPVPDPGTEPSPAKPPPAKQNPKPRSVP